MLDWKNNLSKLPKISIITPSFNQAEFLERTIQSVLEQNYTALEYVVMDGGSTDGSLEILKTYADRITYWSSVKDHGPYDAINRGIKKSSGDIFAWMNSDDMYFPWTFRAVGEIFSQFPEVEWITSLKPCHWDSSDMLANIGQYPGFSREAFLDGHYLPRSLFGPIQQESTFWRRSLWEKVGGLHVEKYPLAGDFDLWTRFYNSSELYGVTIPLAGIRKHTTQRSKALEQYIKEAKSSLDEMRERHNWKPTAKPTKIKKLISKIPFARLYMKNASTRYNCKVVSRNYLEVEQPVWQLQKMYY